MLTDSLNVSLPGADSHIRDALSEEWFEQERLSDVLSRFYDIPLPEEDMVRRRKDAKVFYLFMG